MGLLKKQLMHSSKNLERFSGLDALASELSHVLEHTEDLSQELLDKVPSFQVDLSAANPQSLSALADIANSIYMT